MICDKCGSEINEGAKFCYNCGAEIIQPETNETADNIVTEESNVNADKINDLGYSNLIKICICIACGVILLFVIAALIHNAVSDSPDSAMFSGVIIFACVIGILSVVAWWKIFTKAGELGVWSIVPFVNIYKIYKISWGNGWLCLLILIPFVGEVVEIIRQVKLAESFGHRGGFAIGLIFLNTIFVYILAFGKSEYIGPNGIPQEK